MVARSEGRVVFLCSGAGGNLAFIYTAVRWTWLRNLKIVGVLTDRQCAANILCTALKLYNRVIDFRVNDGSELASALEKLAPDLVITTVHKILRPDLVQIYRGRLINLHYSLLPAFSGLIGAETVSAALNYHSLFGGVTAHLVNEQVDAGRPLVQCAIALTGTETMDSIMPVVFRCGCLVLHRALDILMKGAICANSASIVEILGYTCVINGGEQVEDHYMNNETFWNEIRGLVPRRTTDAST